MLIILFVLQSMVFARLRILGIAPLLLPVAVVGVAMFEGATWGGGFGIAAGVFCDISYSETIVMFTVLLMLLGAGIGLLGEYILARGFPSYLVCCVLMLAVVSFVQMFSFLVFEHVNAGVLIRVALAQTGYSLVFAVPIYYITRTVSRKGYRA